MSDKAWEAFERRVASYFGGERQPATSENTRECRKCGKTKRSHEFSKKDNPNTCDECRLIYFEKYRSENRDQVNATINRWRENNPSKVNTHKQTDKFKRNNRDYQRDWQRERLKDNSYRVLNSLRSRLCAAVRNHEKANSTLDFLGCDFKTFKAHIESKFKPGMSWCNYGEWHIDHIIPCASFDFSAREDQLRCFHYENLQPLWAEENLRKGKRYGG